MANFIYTPSKTDVAEGLLDFREAGADIRAILVMDTTTFDTEEDLATIGAAATPDEFDGPDYTQSVGTQLANQVAREELGQNRNEFDADDVAFGVQRAGTRNITGLVLFRFVTSFALSVPVGYVDFSVTPGNFAANGSTITVTWNLEGIIQIG